MANSIFPRFILNKNRVIDKYRQLRNLGIKVSYSLKTNIEVGKVLEKETDSNFTVHSLKELSYINDKNRAWYFLIATNNEEIEYVLKLGIRNFVVDLNEDLKLLLNYIEKRMDRINLLLRIKLKENTIFSGKYYVYGMDSKKVNFLIPKLKEHSLIDKLGIHFHRKTQNVSEWNIKQEVEDFLTIDNLNKLDIINIGGGLPGKYKSTNDNALNIILNKIIELKSWFDKEIIIEPGRFIASFAITLESEISAIQDNTIFVNCSIYNSAIDTVISNIKLLVEGEEDYKKDFKKYIIKGNTPASEDIFRYEVFLTEKKVGDIIKFLNAGAYNFHSEFCNLQKIPTFIV